MEPLLTREEMRNRERRALESGVPEILLMEHAALALVCALEERFSGLVGQSQGLILAGVGNNGGDVLAAARLLWIKGYRQFRLALIDEPQSEISKIQLSIISNLGITILSEWSAADPCDWVLDGLYGIGLTRPVEGKPREWIERLDRMNRRPWIVSADLPSGLDADTGVPLGVCVRASQTITFGFLKRGLFTGQAANYVGDLRLDPINLPHAFPSRNATPVAVAGAAQNAPRGTWLFERGDVGLPKRLPVSHKGQFGHAKVWCGEKSGAALIAADAAKRTGVGLVSIVGRKTTLEKLETKVPSDVMLEEWTSSSGATALGIGPGLGLGEGDLLAEMLLLSIPIVLDADALTIIGNRSIEFKNILAARKAVTVFTPHPKEAARLVPNLDIERDRFTSARTIADTYGVPTLLKGKGTIIAVPGDSDVVVWEGNSALSRGGTGDLLTGLVTGFMAQKMKGRDALLLAAYFQGAAAVRTLEERGSEATVTIAELCHTIAGVIDDYR